MPEVKASDYVHAALDLLGGEDTEFYLTAQDKSASGAFGRASVVLSCRYQGCDWGLFVGEMELWEFVTDARAHWEDKHAQDKPQEREGEAARSAVVTVPVRLECGHEGVMPEDEIHTQLAWCVRCSRLQGFTVIPARVTS